MLSRAACEWEVELGGFPAKKARTTTFLEPEKSIKNREEVEKTLSQPAEVLAAPLPAEEIISDEEL